MIDERQKAIRERLSKITPGKWISISAKQLDNTGGRDYCIGDDDHKIIAEVFAHVGINGLSYEARPAFANAAFIAAAPDDISYLLVALAEARELLNDLSESREFALYITPESKFGIRLAAWQEIHPEKGRDED